MLTSDGLVLTNNHVIEGATAVKVTDIGNGATYPAKVVGYDATKDVAVIQLQSASGLATASLGDSSTVQAGASVANADIQPGDSGGSLVNSHGQVIGVDTAASAQYQRHGQPAKAAEQAYAIPIDQALSIARQIQSGTGTPDVHIGATGFLGIEIENSDSASGVALAGTLPGSPAASAWPDPRRCDHRDRRPVGLHRGGPREGAGPLPPRQLDLDGLGGPVRERTPRR